ncbi:MAG TPA: Stp1/IreP family PP2C-type Ser/Thr phosphatase [Clostridiaceae bacterium]|nr:Stp1/IreP family PP2C-type Ser/Thr phosphatase [Clostridiaceae bacterium]
MEFAARCDRGLIRENNEDSYNIISGHKDIPITFIIADGMGGHNSGEIASKTAVDYISKAMLEFPEKKIEDKDLTLYIKEIIEKANDEVLSVSKERIENYGMGTTLIVASAWADNLYIGHVGDSRLYLIREGKIQRVTTDHSYIEELVKNGTLTREEAENHPQKNIITRALGCFEEIMVDTYICEIRNGDYFVLCTDGLTNMLSENEIRDIVLSADNPEFACDILVRKANENGGEDNITVIVIKN